jgi:hypothetical protein
MRAPLLLAVAKGNRYSYECIEKSKQTNILNYSTNKSFRYGYFKGLDSLPIQIEPRMQI